MAYNLAPLSGSKDIDRVLGELILSSSGMNKDKKLSSYKDFNSRTKDGAHRRTSSLFVESLEVLLQWRGSSSQNALAESNHLLEQALDNSPSSCVIRVEQAYRSLVSGDIPVAQQLCGEASSASGWYARYHSTLANVHLEYGRVEDATKSFITAQVLSPRFHCAHFGYALLALRLGDSEAAETGFQQLLDWYPGNFHAVFGVALTRATQGDLEGALENAGSVIEGSGFKPALELAVGLAIGLGNPNLAAQHLDTLETIDPDSKLLPPFREAVDSLFRRDLRSLESALNGISRHSLNDLTAK